MPEFASETLSVSISRDLFARAKLAAKNQGFENISQLVRALLRKATRGVK
jgi:metal-responsive CopG/Arc/MetJ family transcriptional regulator